MSALNELVSRSARTAFDKKVLSALQYLHPYVKHRIYIAEETGILPKNMFSSNDIIDESIINLYSKGFNVDSEPLAVKLELFKMVDLYMNVLFKNEVYHKNTISTDSILKSELSKLEEDYTVDADLDYILNTELNDISYHQDQAEQLHLYADKESSILKAFDVKDLSSSQSPKVFSQFYNWLPFNVSNIVDLYIFGKLDFDAIAKIKKIEQKRVEMIFDKVKLTFRRHIE